MSLFSAQVMSGRTPLWSRVRQKIFRENCNENVVSDWKKNVLCVHKTTFRKSSKTKKKQIIKKTDNVQKFWRIMGTKLVVLVNFWDHIIVTVFPKHFFLFSTLISKMSRNMCYLRHKVRNGHNLPHESPNFTNYFFLSKFTYNFVHFSTNLRPNYKNNFF